MHPKTVSEVFEDVEKGKVPYGVVPIENSTEVRSHIPLICLRILAVTFVQKLTANSSFFDESWRYLKY